MTTNKKELAVAALQNGTVIDHIPSAALFQVVKILGIENMDKSVTIGNNLESKKLGRKGIIKIADTEFAEDMINRIAIIAPTAVVNIIRDFEVVEKRPVVLPDNLVGILRCSNPKCITNNEPMRTRFTVIKRGNENSADDTIIRCDYCNHSVSGKKAQIL